MARDLKDLMQEALPQHVAEPDLDRIEQRVARRHTVRLAGAAAGVIGAVAVGVAALAGISAPEAPVIEEPPTPAVEETTAPTVGETAAPTETQEAGRPPVPFSLETMPVMAEEGVAIDTGGGVRFVGLDGTDFGTLAGYELAFDLPPASTPGLVLVRRPGELGAGIWVAPDQAATLGYARGVPIGFREVMTAGNEPGTWLLEDFDGETHLVRDDAGWWLSADHRAITWVDPDGVRQHLDFDMGGYGTEEDGCHSVDEFADLNGIRLCSHTQASWLDVWSAGSPDGPRRIEAPALDAERWVFERAFFGGPGVVAMLTDADGHRSAVVGFTLEGEQVAILPDELDTTATSLLGVDRQGSAIVQAPYLDAEDDRQEPGGVYVLDQTTGEARQIWDDGSRGVQLWTGAIDLATIAGQLEGATTQPAGRLVSITAVDTERRTVTVDERRWLTGDEARAVYEEETGDPSGPPNDYMLEDVDGLEGELEVVDGATVLVPGELPETVEGDLADIATWIGRTGPFLAWVEEVEPGRLGAIRWQYTP